MPIYCDVRASHIRCDAHGDGAARGASAGDQSEEGVRARASSVCVCVSTMSDEKVICFACR